MMNDWMKETRIESSAGSDIYNGTHAIEMAVTTHCQGEERRVRKARQWLEVSKAKWKETPV